MQALDSKDSLTNIIAGQREKIVFGDPETCFLKQPLARVVQVKTPEGVLTWNAKPYLSPAQKLVNKKILTEIFGSFTCQRCGRELTWTPNKQETATLEHLPDETGKRNPFHNCIHANSLFCNSCNSSTRNHSIARQSSPSNERERETPIHHSIGGDEAKPTTVAMNEEYEEELRRFVIKEVKRRGYDNLRPTDIEALRRDVLLGAASEWVGCNPKTAYPYFKKFDNAINGFLMNAPYKDSSIKIMQFRDASYYNLTVDEIMQRHPKAGLRFGIEIVNLKSLWKEEAPGS